MANNQEYRKYTVYSTPDPSSGFDIHRYDRDYNLMKKAVEASLPKDAFYYMSPKRIDKNSGQMSMDIYVHSDDAGVAGSSIGTQISELLYKKSINERYDVTGAQTLTKEEQKLISKMESKGEESETSRFNKSSFLKVIAVLTAIASIARRILSSVMTFSQQTVKDMVTAHNLGMSYESVRSYRHIETAHGMKEGTITGAVADIQTKFGNITSLDEKALEALAVVMGGKIEEMAKMGLGASNPEKILGAILDDFNAKANAGYNSVGQYVGEAQARRELYSYLLKVSPQVADIFATMQEEQHNINSIYRNQADTFEKFKNLNTTSRGGNGKLDYGVTVTLGEEWNQLKDTVDQIKEAFIVGFAPTLLALTRRIADTRVGMTETERRERNKENKEINKQALERTRKTMAYYEGQGLDNLSAEDKAYYLALRDYAEELEKENKKSTINNLDKTYAEVKLEGMKYLDAVNKQTHNKALMSLGFSESVNDATDEEIASTIEAYNYDTPKARKEFKEYKTEQNQKIAKALEKLDEDARKEEFTNAKRNAEAEVKAEKKDKNSLLRKTRDRIAPMYRNRFDLVMSAYKTFNLDYDLSSGLWAEEPEKAMFNAQHWLAEKGYIFEDALGIPYFTFAENKNYKQSQESKDKIRGTFSAVTDDDYMYWLYEQNKDSMDESILALRADLAEQRYKQARMADNFNILYDSEGTNRDWQTVVAKALSKGGTGRLYAVNDSSNGENYLRFRLEINDNGKVTTKEVYSIFGVNGEEGFMGTVTYDKESKNVTLDPASSGSSASQTVKKGD